MALLAYSLLMFFAGRIKTVASNPPHRPPAINSEPLKDVYFKPKEAVQLSCVARGIPLPLYRWKFNGEDFNPIDHGAVQLPNLGTVVFHSPEEKDAGIYQCFADNGYGVSASVKYNMRMARLEEFFFMQARTHSILAGEFFSLPCIPPVSDPMADLIWVIKGPYGEWTAINFDKRVTMDLEGRLRFANVQKDDENDGKAYVCVAVSYILRKSVTGPEHFIKVLGSSGETHRASELWTSPQDQIFFKGSQLKLKCIFAGNPAPDVSWTRIEGSNEVDIPSVWTKDFGMTLSIRNITTEDAGMYKCTGANAASFLQVMKMFNIRVEAAPYWINEPEDQEKLIGETATFICRAGGIPEPSYIWYINGILLDDVRDERIYNSNRFFKPNQNNITITNLTLEDHFNVQCNATNKHGYEFSDVFLNVL